jgi:alpha-D-xyloside xylohydrolase
MMDFKDDPKTLDNNREFLFGRSLLVAPVVEALYTPEKIQKEVTADWTAKKTFDVYLPQGIQWYDYWTKERLEGGQTVKADGTLAHCPVYVKAGSILPLCKKEVMNANIADWQTLDLLVYPGTDATFTLYEDEGDNYNYEKGVYTTIPIKWSEHTHTLTIGERKGSYPGMQEKRSFTVITPDGKSQTVEYNGKEVKCKF